MIKVVYIAGKFRGPDAWQIELNIRKAEELAWKVWEAGAAALCPHANTRYFQGSLPDHIWLDGDLAMLERCDAILMVDGWETSTGAKMERVHAINHQIPVFYMLEDLKIWLERNQ